jgi:hypothetical protein
MADLREIQAKLGGLRAQRDEERQSLRRASADLRTLDAAIAAAERGADRQDVERLAALRREREEKARSVETRKFSVKGAREVLQEQIELLFRDAKPQELVEQMRDDVPMLLLPLRIETKYAGNVDRPELCVRIFPDEIAIAHHEKALSSNEAASGEKYWRARCEANALTDPQQRENANRGAWSALASRHGAYRAGWIAKSLRPRNWSDTQHDPAALRFPQPEIQPSTWVEAPRARLMPDRFVVTLISGNVQRAYVGLPIPDDLPLGPDPTQAESVLTRGKDGRIVMDKDLLWLTDFDRAVELGMGLRITLEPPFNTPPIQQLIVLGVRSTLDAAASAEALGQLVEGHRFSGGVGIVRQGTPTNNTESAKAGFTTSGDVVDQVFELEEKPLPLDFTAGWRQRQDGVRLARALGLSPEQMRTLPNAGATDIADAIAMKRALAGDLRRLPGRDDAVVHHRPDHPPNPGFLPSVRRRPRPTAGHPGGRAAVWRAGDQFPVALELVRERARQWREVLERPSGRAAQTRHALGPADRERERGRRRGPAVRAPDPRHRTTREFRGVLLAHGGAGRLSMELHQGHWHVTGIRHGNLGGTAEEQDRESLLAGSGLPALQAPAPDVLARARSAARPDHRWGSGVAAVGGAAHPPL